MGEWVNFFAVKLPLAVLAVAVVVELLAWPLSNVTPHRHNVDDLANAVQHDVHPYRVVLLGDSVTHNVSNKYRIGDPGEVADVTTHALAGLPGSYFLLRRYLESGHRPNQVVLALSRHVLTEPMDHDTFDYYITSVFKKPDERAFLQAHYPDYVNYTWRPAALSMTALIGEPLFSLLRHPGDQIWIAPALPAAHPELESFSDYQVDPVIFRQTVAASSTIRPEARALLEAMCQLSREYHFAFHIIWAPIRPDLHQAMVASGAIPHLNEQTSAILRNAGLDPTLDDAADGHNYPYFDRNLIHIRGLGWEQVYANELADYIHEFESRNAVAPQASSAAQNASTPSPRYALNPSMRLSGLQ